MENEHDASVRRRLGRIKNAVDRLFWLTTAMALIQLLILFSIWSRLFR